MASSTERLAAKMAKSRGSGIHIKPSKQGSLHSALGIPQSQKIPAALINQRLAGNPSEAMRKKLQFAKNARSWG
jgi:hypothetical protein